MLRWKGGFTGEIIRQYSFLQQPLAAFLLNYDVKWMTHNCVAYWLGMLQFPFPPVFWLLVITSPGLSVLVHADERPHPCMGFECLGQSINLGHQGFSFTFTHNLDSSSSGHSSVMVNFHNSCLLSSFSCVPLDGGG